MTNNHLIKCLRIVNKVDNNLSTPLKKSVTKNYRTIMSLREMKL